MSYADWDTYAVCECGQHYVAPFGDKFHIHREVCASCGADKRGWKLKVMRWVATGRLLSPSTWGAGHWEERDGSRA